LNWILYDRSPDCFVSPWESPSRRPGLLGNSFQPDGVAKLFDLAIAAGTPEWRGPHFAPVFVATASTPWMFLGVDHVHEAEISPTAEEIGIWSTAAIVTRGSVGTEALARIGIQAQTMPCPSLFAAEWEQPSRALSTVGVIVQNDSVVNQSIPEDLKQETIRLIGDLRERYQVVAISNYINEFQELCGKLDVPVRYSYDSTEYAAIMSGCDVIVSTRLHSAFLANSLLKPAIVVNPNVRVLSATELYPHVLVRETKQVLECLRELDIDTTVRDLFNWKRMVESQYRGLLIAHLQRYGLYQL
jgi:hypothetical protein